MGRQKPDLLKTVEALGIETRRIGRELVGKVPWREDLNPSLRINEDKQVWFDNPANESGDAWELVKRTLNVDFNGALIWAEDKGLVSKAGSNSAAGGDEGTQSRQRGQQTGNNPAVKSWLWKTSGESERVFEGLPPAAFDQAARRFFESSYGLAAATLPNEWKLFNHPTHGAGIVYPAKSINGGSVFKFKSFARDGNGKRRSVILHGHAGEAAYLYTLPNQCRWCVVTGEEKQRAVWNAGWNIIGAVTGEAAFPQEWLAWLVEQKPEEIVLAFDADETGKAATANKARRLLEAGYRGSIRAVRWSDNAPKGWDLNDVLKQSGLQGVKEILDLASLYEADAGEDFSPDGNKAAGNDKRESRSIGIILADVERREIEWLWQGLIPKGKLTVLDGDPGLGKSTLTLDIAARVSRGAAMPSGEALCKVGGVLIFSAEDDLADTVRPRLEAAGADLNRIKAIKTIPDKKGERLPSIPEDLAIIQAETLRMDARLVIIDPIMAYLSGDVNSFRDQDVRRALAPLAGLAERTGAAILIVRHLNKAIGGKAIYRGGGSIGISGAARSVLLVAQDSENEDESARVLASVKSNLARKPKSLAFRMVETSLTVARVDWTGASDLSADDLLQDTRKEAAKKAVDRAKEFLIETLENGQAASEELFTAGKDQGISKRTLFRAKKDLGIKARKNGFGGGWFWQLESIVDDENGRRLPKAGEGCQSNNGQPWGENGHLREIGDWT